MPDRHLLTRAAFIEELQQHAPLAWPAVWGAAHGHIEACLETAYLELERLLAIPEMHRTRLRMEMRQVLKVIAEEGPERSGRFLEDGVVLPLRVKATAAGLPCAIMLRRPPSKKRSTHDDGTQVRV